MYKGFSRSVMGASHETRGTVCQDSSDYKVTDAYAAAVVADGHGSKKHFRSNMGSRFAVQATLQAVENFYTNETDFEENFPKNHRMIIKNIEKQIISNWNVLVTEHLKSNPVTEEERSAFTDEEFEAILPESYYGSTLIAAFAGKKFTFGIQIGDGNLVAIFDDGVAVMPMEYDESAPANVTASICNAGAASMFQSFYIENKRLLALYASTDGLYTSFGSDYDFLDYHTIITSQLSQSDKFEESVAKNLVKRSRAGTQDDVSLSCVYDVEAVRELTAFLKKKVAENKEMAAERKRKLLNKG